MCNAVMDKLRRLKPTLALGGLMLGFFAQGAQALIISEYVEGSGNNKAIEITNVGSTTTSFTGVQLRFYANANMMPSFTINLGTMPPLAAGESYVVTSNEASAALTAIADSRAGVNSNWFNGNDAVELLVGGMRHDLFGVIGGNPSSGWSGGGVQTWDRTLIRKNDVCAGVTTTPTAFDPSVQWLSRATDDFSNLGSHTHSCSSGMMPGGITPISMVQGSGMRSPLVGRTVTVEGIITGASQSFTGYYDEPTPMYAYAPVVFIQSETADADPLTSEGLAIHAGVAGAPPLPSTAGRPTGFPASPLTWDGASYGIAGAFPRLPLGSLVRITGTVEEFRADTRNTNCGMATENKCETRLRPSAITVVRSATLPVPTSLMTGIPADMTSPDYFERFEGMRVTTGTGRFVSGPSKFFEDNAGPLISTDPNPSTTMAKRLPSERAAYAIGVRNWECRGRYNCAIPTNSGSYPPNVAVGTVLNEVIGPFTFDYDFFRVVAQQVPWTVAAGMARAIPSPLPSANMGVSSTRGEVIFGSFNVKKAGLGAAPDNKINKVALTIKQMSCPDVIGLQEFQTPLSHNLTDRNSAINDLVAALQNLQCSYAPARAICRRIWRSVRIRTLVPPSTQAPIR